MKKKIVIPDIIRGEKIIADLMQWLQIPITESTSDTPKRVARMYIEELFKGLYNPPPEIKTFKSKDAYVSVTDIHFTSFCEHHLLPFMGKCGVVYHARDRVIGISKISRIVEYWSARPQIQENLTHQIAEDIMKRLQPYGAYVVMSAQHLCYTDDTEILTEKGFIPFPLLPKNIKVAQFNNNDGSILFIKPRKYIKLKYTGRIINFKNYSFDLAVTPEHKCLVNSEWKKYNSFDKYYDKKAGEVTGNIFMKRVGKFNSFNAKYKVLGGVKIPFEKYAKFMGMYLSKGCSTYTKSNRNYAVRISQNKISKGFGEFKNLLDSLSFHYAYNESGKYFVIYNKQLYKDLLPFGKSGNKFVPSDIKYSSIKNRMTFLHFYWLGDGCFKSSNRCFTTISKKMADDIQEIFTLSNIGSSLNIRNNGAFDVLQHRTRKGKDKTESFIRKKNISSFLYSGFVYCVTVPSGYLVVRRNGRTAISGNCSNIRGIRSRGSVTNTATLLGNINVDEAMKLLTLKNNFGD